jgi:hypothetical protein
MEQVGLSFIKHSQPKGVKSKIRRRELRSSVYFHGALKQTDVKQELYVAVVWWGNMKGRDHFMTAVDGRIILKWI